MPCQEKRRSRRVFIRIPVWAAGCDVHSRRFRDTAETIAVNAHCGLLCLNEALEIGSQLLVTNPETQAEQDCRVVFLGEVTEEGQRVGIEFLTPPPGFWGVESAPADEFLPISPGR